MSPASRPPVEDRIELSVDGRPLQVAAGTSLAAALLNGGVRAFRRSVGGGGRGPLCGMGTCHECRVTIDGVPHRRACLVQAIDGTRVETSPTGAAAAAPDLPPRDVELLEADVVIVGAGPAGMTAATRAAGHERRVVVLDENPREGGQIWRHRPGAALPREAEARIRRFRRADARTIHGASVVGALEPGLLLVERPDGAAVRVRWREALILAPGARERTVPFPGWTLPGVVGVGGAQALRKAGLEVRGLRTVVAGTGPLLLPVGALLAGAGASLAFVAEQAEPRRLRRFALGLSTTPGLLVEALRYRAAFFRTPFRAGWWVRAARGEDRVEEVTLTDGTRERTFPCDLLAVGHGLVPATELPRALGCATGPTGVVVDEWQETTVPGIFCAGDSTGVAGARAAVTEGAIAGLAAGGRHDEARALLERRDRARAFGRRLEEAFRLRDELRASIPGDTVLCRCEDVRVGEAAAFRDARHAKLATRCGMGPCQGRVCGPAGAFLFEWEADSVREPVIPARLATLARGGG